MQIFGTSLVLSSLSFNQASRTLSQEHCLYITDVPGEVMYTGTN